MGGAQTALRPGAEGRAWLHADGADNRALAHPNGRNGLTGTETAMVAAAEGGVPRLVEARALIAPVTRPQSSSWSPGGWPIMVAPAPDELGDRQRTEDAEKQ